MKLKIMIWVEIKSLLEIFRLYFFFQDLFCCPTANFGQSFKGQPHLAHLLDVNHCVYTILTQRSPRALLWGWVPKPGWGPGFEPEPSYSQHLNTLGHFPQYSVATMIIYSIERHWHRLSNIFKTFQHDWFRYWFQGRYILIDPRARSTGCFNIKHEALCCNSYKLDVWLLSQRPPVYMLQQPWITFPTFSMQFLLCFGDEQVDKKESNLWTLPYVLYMQKYK